MLGTMTRGLAAAALAAAVAAPAAAQNLMISSALPQVHFWTGQILDPFADKMEAETDITFTRFYAGELTGVGRGLDALQGGTVDVVSPLLAPYHPGAFPLTDISQLPVYGTDSPAITRAFQKLLDSEDELADGKTFYEYEVEDKGIVAWGLAATGAYGINTVEKRITSPADFQGLPMRAGAALQTMTLERLGVNPVTMPASQAYEALSRRTIEGILFSVADWKSYSFTELLKYAIEGVALGHWESYHAISKDAWDRLSPEQQEAFDRDHPPGRARLRRLHRASDRRGARDRHGRRHRVRAGRGPVARDAGPHRQGGRRHLDPVDRDHGGRGPSRPRRREDLGPAGAGGGRRAARRRRRVSRALSPQAGGVTPPAPPSGRAVPP